MNARSLDTCNDSKRGMDELVEENMHLVRIIAHQMVSNLPPQIDINDLMSAGMIGLVEAASRFDSSKKAKFNTYASMRIRGAMLDELRDLDWMTRSMRLKSNMLDWASREIEKREGRPAEAEELAECLDISLEELEKIMREVKGVSVLNLDELSAHTDDQGINLLECIKDPQGVDPMAGASLNQFKSKLSEAVDKISERERHLISLYYNEGLTLKEISKVMRITESRVCQLHGDIMGKLKKELNKDCIYSSRVS